MPLSYPSAQCVLEHMEANQRYFLAARCPSLRALHKSVPLSIQYINMSKTSVVVNDFEHSFHCLVAPKYEGQELPGYVQLENSRGGSPFDLTEFGYIDARIYMEGTEHEDLDGEELFRMFIGDHGPVYDTYITYITYSIQRNGGPERSVRYADGIKIRDAFNAFLQNFMGGSRIPNVGCLEVAPQSVAKIPSGLKFNVREVRVLNNSKTDHIPHIEQFLNPACLPLKRVFVTSWEVESYLPSHHPILYTSLHLEIQRYHGPLVEPPIDVDLVEMFAEEGLEVPQRSLPWNNRSVYVRDNNIPMNRLIEFVQHWSEKPKDIGTTFSFSVANCMEIIRRVGGTQATIPSRPCPEIPHGTSFRIAGGLELNVYGYETPSQMEELEDEDDKLWMLVMEYMEEGSAVPVNN